MLGTQQSYNQRDSERKSWQVESPKEAKLRTQKKKALQQVGLWKKKCHSPDPNSVDFDEEGLLQSKFNERGWKTKNM